MNRRGRCQPCWPYTPARETRGQPSIAPTMPTNTAQSDPTEPLKTADLPLHYAENGASARSCLPSPADQQAPELDGPVTASLREGRRTRVDSATPATAAERFSADAVRGGSVRGTVDASGCLSTPRSSSTAYE